MTQRPATAERLAADGQTVAIIYAGNDDAAKSVVEDITAAGGSALAIKADVADEIAVAHAFDTVEREFGGVDVVVHAAGIMLLSPLADLDLADLDRMHRVNIRGTSSSTSRQHGGSAAVEPLSTSPPRW